MDGVRGFRIVLAVFVGLSACLYPIIASASSKRPKPIVEVGAVSLEELCKDAGDIFVGTVVSVVKKEVTLAGETEPTKLPAILITFNVSKKLKGSFDEKKSFELLQFEIGSMDLKKDEEVLLYLSEPSPKTGFASPVGIYSGDFRIKSDSRDSRYQVALNGKNNTGLWSDKKSLFSEKAFSKLEAKIEGLRGTLKDKRVDKLLEIADKPNTAGVLPLELLVAATEVALAP